MDWLVIALLVMILYVLLGVKERLVKQYDLMVQVADKHFALNSPEPPDHPMYGGD